MAILIGLNARQAQAKMTMLYVSSSNLIWFDPLSPVKMNPMLRPTTRVSVIHYLTLGGSAKKTAEKRRTMKGVMLLNDLI